MKKIIIVSLIVAFVTYLIGSNTPFITTIIGTIAVFITVFMTASVLLDIEKRYMLPVFVLVVVGIVLVSFVSDNLIAKQITLYPILGMTTATILLFFIGLLFSQDFDPISGLLLGALLCVWIGYIAHLQLIKETVYLTVTSGIGFILWAFVLHEQKEIAAWSQESESREEEIK